MRTIERDYKYLLENLIPLNRLLPIRRRKISEALKGGDRLKIRQEAVLALEELVHSSYLRRDCTTVEKENVRVAYTKSSGYHKFLLKVPLKEWERLGIASITSRDVEEIRGKTQSDVYTPSAEALPELIRSFSINENNGSLLQKLEKLLDKLSSIFLLPQLKLYIAEEKVGDSGIVSSKISIRSLDELKKNPMIAHMLAKGSEDGDFPVKGERKIDEILPGGVRIMVPLRIMNEPWGALESSLKSESTRGSIEAKMGIAAGIVGQMIINNIRLENLISIDKLTRVYNRHFYDIQLPIEIERATRSGNKLSMLVIDIDDFKRINDIMGHQKGDEALEVVADLIRRNLRKIDLAFRYGGEEFVILLPGTGQMEALHTAERLRSRIAEYRDFKDQMGKPMTITVSIGLAVFPDYASNGEELFIQADRAMFRAKRMGKNRIEVMRE